MWGISTFLENIYTLCVDMCLQGAYVHDHQVGKHSRRNHQEKKMAYRIHPKNESPETVLNHDRPMGWTVDGEEPIRGISAMASLAMLASYTRNYGMRIHPEDMLLDINGEHCDGHDAGEVVCLPTSFEVIATGAEFLAAMEVATMIDDEGYEAPDSYYVTEDCLAGYAELREQYGDVVVGMAVSIHFEYESCFEF